MRYFTLWVFERPANHHFALDLPPEKILWGSHYIQRGALDALVMKGTVRVSTRQELHEYAEAFNGDLPSGHSDNKPMRIKNAISP